MKKTINILIPMLLVSFLSVANALAIQWIPYDQGLKTGKATHRKVFLNFYADWCGYCKKMDAETFKDPEVAQYLEENFVSIRVNSEKDADLARSYFVRGLPSSWFIDENGDKISDLPGFVPPDMFLTILKYIHSDSYQEMTFKEFMDKQL